MNDTNMHPTLTLLLALAFAAPLTACSAKSEESSGSAGAKNGQAGSEAPAKDIAATFGDTPSIPSIFEGLDIGMQESAAGGSLPIAIDDYGDDVFIAQAAFTRSGILTELEIDVSKAVEAKLHERWGEPMKITINGEDAGIWLDPATTLRVRATSSISDGHVSLAFSRYEPYRALMGEGASVPFLPEDPLHGKSEDAVKAALGDAVEGSGTALELPLPATEFDSPYASPTLKITLARGEVSRVTWSIPYLSDESRDEILAFVRTKWGEPASSDPAENTYDFVVGPRAIRAFAYDDRQWNFYVTAPG